MGEDAAVLTVDQMKVSMRFMFVLMPGLIIAGSFISAGILHICLIGCPQGAPKPFEATYPVDVLWMRERRRSSNSSLFVDPHPLRYGEAGASGHGPEGGPPCTDYARSITAVIFARIALLRVGHGSGHVVHSAQPVLNNAQHRPRTFWARAVNRRGGISRRVEALPHGRHGEFRRMCSRGSAVPDDDVAERGGQVRKDTAGHRIGKMAVLWN